MTLQSTYQPINGEEGREIIKRSINEKVDKIPMMKKGHAYHKFTVDAIITITAFPKDVPVPEVDFKKLITVADNPLPTFEKVEEQITALEEVKDKLLKKLEKVNNTLSVLRPQEVIEVHEEAGDKPDELRIAKGMPIPMIERTGAGIREIMVDPSKVQVQR